MEKLTEEKQEPAKLEENNEKEPKEELKKPLEEEIPHSGRMRVRLSDKCKHRSWTDIIPGWIIYRREEKLTPNRWSSQMKRAMRDGILEIVERNPKGKISSFDPIGPKGEEIKPIEVVTSDKSTEMGRGKIIELVKKPQETIIHRTTSKKLEEALKSKEPVTMNVKVKETPLPKQFTETR